MGSESLAPAQSIDVPLCLHAVASGDQRLRVLVVYREVNNLLTHNSRARLTFNLRVATPLLRRFL